MQAWKTVRSGLARWLERREHSWTPAAVGLGSALALAALVGLIGLGGAPRYSALGPYDLGAHGYPGVELTLVYPRRLGAGLAGGETESVVVDLRASSETPIGAIDMVLPSPDESIGWADAEGRRVSGRLSMVPGYPEAWPYELWVADVRTSRIRGPMRSHAVTIVPQIQRQGRWAPVPELAFTVRMEAPIWIAVRRIGQWLAILAAPVAILLAAAVALRALVRRASMNSRRARQHLLEAHYAQLREHVRLSQWVPALAAIELIEQLEPHYRDVPELARLVSAAESRSWRLNQLYQAAMEAYRLRLWPEAVHSARAIQAEAPYYGDIRFVERTAALYADLAGRDRSQRLAAARDLGEVADLIDLEPLIQALGDPSSEVADAAEASLGKMGAAAVDALVDGLACEQQAIRDRTFRLLASLGHGAREQLARALSHDDTRITGSASRLLARLGATEELATCLGWIGRDHQPEVVEALVSEGVPAYAPLVQALLDAPPDRRDVFIRALQRLRSAAAIDRALEDLERSTKDPRHKVLLRRVLAAETDARGTPAADAPPRENLEPSPPEQAGRQRLRVLAPRFGSRRSSGG